MSWGFFLYAIWFNPGQDFVYFLVLQEHPPLLLAQELAASLAHGAQDEELRAGAEILEHRWSRDYVWARSLACRRALRIARVCL